MKEKTKKIILYAGGFLIGIINGLLGAGGGMLAVPLLSKFGGMDQRTAQANSVAVILPLTVFSAVMYILRDSVNIRRSYICSDRTSRRDNRHIFDKENSQ